MSRKKKLQKKIAVAVSVVNLLNMGAPLMLPYVNVAGRVPAAGGQIVQFADTAQSVLYGTAHAANYTVPPNSTVDVMNADDTMNVNNSGTGTVTTMTGGVQNVNSGGAGTVVTMSGGRQIINNGGTGTVTTMNGGEQIVSSGGTGTVSSLQNGGTQIVYNGGMAISTTIDNGGTQSVLSGGTATDTTLKNKGKQIVSSGGVASGGTFSGVNTNTRGYQEVYEGGTVVGAIFSAFGNQTVTGGMARDTTVCGGTIVSGGTTVSGGGIQAITNKGVSLNATIMSGGTQSATEGGILAGTQTIEAGASASGGTLKEISVEGKTFKGVQNVNSGGTANNITVTGGGTQFVLNGGTANGVTLDGGTLSMAGGAIASGTVGGHGKVVYDGGSGQIPLGGTNNFSSFTVSGGTLETQNGFQINSSGGITVNSGGTLIAGGAVTVQTSGSSLTVSGGGTFSAANISAENGGEVSMSGGVLQAAGDITVRHALTNAYGDVSAGGTLTVGGGATQPGSSEQLNLSAGRDIHISGAATVTSLSAGSNISAGGQAVSATNISAGGAIAAGSITAANVSAGGNISASANIRADSISAGGTISAGGNLETGTLALSAVPASGAAVSAAGDVKITNLNVSDFNPAHKTSGALISAGGTVSEMAVNGKSLTAGGTITTNAKQMQLASGIDATFDSLSVSLAADQKALTYDANNTYTNINFTQVTWQKGAVLFDGSSADNNYSEVKALGTDNFNVVYASPESVAAGDSMTLLKANATLQDMAEQTKRHSYRYTPVAGVTVDGNITGRLTTSKGIVTYTPSANQATKLTFGNVVWKDSGALMTRPANITFAGADVDTSKINFTNVTSLGANQKMTLVSGFGNSVGTIIGTKYKVGTGLEGDGEASLSGNDLIFTTKTGANNLTAQEQTHKTVMAMEAGMALLAAGNEHVGNAMDGICLADNAGSDGISVAASLGGGASHYETGSHVNSHTWNAVVAVGRNNETKKGNLKYGIFGEYGKGSYTLHSDAGRGDGDSHYAGGGLLVRWTNKHNVYTETSLRLGRMNDTASDILHDEAGNGYGYDVHANYFGAHVGVGQVTNYRNGRRLDVYGKYFYTRRDGVNFDAGLDHYDLNSVASSVLRIGARYGTTVKKWNWYGGLAYEYEFDGKSAGTVTNGGVSAAIRSASVKGSSVRCELGLRMDATKDNPWKADIAIYGYGGKHRGFGGNVNVAYTF